MYTCHCKTASKYPKKKKKKKKKRDQDERKIPTSPGQTKILYPYLPYPCGNGIDAD